jgi:type II secretory pathway pseudopilin PulG
VVLSIVAVLAAMLLDRLSKLRVEAERVTVAHVLGSLRSALALEVAAHMASGSTGAIEDLIGTNPMDRLSPQPENYLGALDDPDPAQIPRGRWYFNTNRQLLIYRVRHAGYFRSDLPGPERVRFKSQRSHSDYNPAGN